MREVGVVTVAARAPALREGLTGDRSVHEIAASEIPASRGRVVYRMDTSGRGGPLCSEVRRYPQPDCCA